MLIRSLFAIIGLWCGLINMDFTSAKTFDAPSKWKQVVNKYPVLSHSGGIEAIELTPDHRRVIQSVHDSVSEWGYKERPTDNWDLTLPGNCVDHALAKYQDLVQNHNFSPGNLSLGTCRVQSTTRNETIDHAFLIVNSTEGNLVVNLDPKYGSYRGADVELLSPLKDFPCTSPWIMRSVNNDSWEMWR